ncbi:hypothetical protein GGR50DRAFT_668627 [Xylaria sp. CBS 124048]|nr:hypothetical protein GGR50DRAFT_668627 [Xylaria sp. CBS 124048]
MRGSTNKGKQVQQGQTLHPSEPAPENRSSFSLSDSFQSLKRAISGRGRKSATDGTNDKDVGSSAATSSPYPDPPPAYTEVAESSNRNNQGLTSMTPFSRIPSVYARIRDTENQHITGENEFKFLAEFDTAFLIDDSSSMSRNDWGHPRPRQGELSRWEQTRNVIEQIVPICMRYDTDGIDLYFLNEPYDETFFTSPRRYEPFLRHDGIVNEGKAIFVYAGVKDAEDVRRMFSFRRPALYTPTGKRLGQILKTYVDCYEARIIEHRAPPKPLNIIVITDGEASDKQVLRDSLIEQAERLDALNAPYHQLGVQFIQVGKDARAADDLRELDDYLAKRGRELRDIVDCVTHEEMSGNRAGFLLTADVILKIVLGAVNKRLDNLHIRQGALVES